MLSPCDGRVLGRRFWKIGRQQEAFYALSGSIHSLQVRWQRNNDIELLKYGDQRCEYLSIVFGGMYTRWLRIEYKRSTYTDHVLSSAA